MNDDGSYSFVPCSSKKHLDQYLDFEDFDDNETEIDSKAELPCPFCFEDFDIVGLYCHIDEQHPIEAESGVCPVCSLRAGMNIVGHMTSKHGDLFTLRHKLKLLKSETWSSPSLSRKDSLEGHLESFLRGSSHGFSSPNTMEPDPLSTLVYNPPTADEPESVHPRSLTVPELPKESSESSILESSIKWLSLNSWLIQMFYSNNGRESVNQSLDDLFQKYVILHRRTYVYKPQQNDIVEYKNRHHFERYGVIFLDRRASISTISVIGKGPRGVDAEMRVCTGTIMVHLYR